MTDIEMGPAAASARLAPGDGKVQANRRAIKP